MDPVPIKPRIRTLRKTGRNSSEMAKSKVFDASRREVSTTSPLLLAPQPGERETGRFTRGAGSILIYKLRDEEAPTRACMGFVKE